jgi:hypothetical protein
VAQRLLTKRGVRPTRAVVVLSALLGLAMVPTRVSAQSTGRFAVGGNFRILTAPDGEAEGSISPGLLWRFGHDEGGWGLNFGLNWYNTDLQRPVGGSETPFGQLRVRPFMAGYGYKVLFRNTSVTFDAIGGYAFTSFKLNPKADDAFRARLGAKTIDVSSSNTLVVKPEITVWIDLSERVGLQINGGYMFARPKVRVTSSLGEDERRYRADMVVLQVGAVYSIF